MTEPALARLAEAARCVLLDFDRPCGILAGRCARTGAAELRAACRRTVTWWRS